MSTEKNKTEVDNTDTKPKAEDQKAKAETKNKATKKKWFQRPVAILAIVFLLFLSLGIVAFQFTNRDKEEPETVESSSSSSSSSLESESNETKVEVDPLALELKKQLKETLGIDMGMIYSDTLDDLNITYPIQLTEEQKNISPEEAKEYFPEDKPRLEELVPAPENPEKINWISIPDYGVEAPIVNATFQDLFEEKGDGDNVEVDFTKPIQEDPAEIARGNYESVPIQVLLKDGVVHLPFSPRPGEIGQSYIIGHSSNFSVVDSDYNEVFAPIERKTKPGDEFFIYDHLGRKLKFRVFEAISIREEDVDEAYKSFPNRRVVTLQASILENVNGTLQPTKRWLTRGELVVEE